MALEDKIREIVKQQEDEKRLGDKRAEQLWNRTAAIPYLGLDLLTDPDADRLVVWDDIDGSLQWLVLGSYLSYDHATHTLSVLGGGGGYINFTGTPVQYDYARFVDVDTVEGRSYSEILSDLSGQAAAAFDWNGQNLSNMGTGHYEFNDFGVNEHIDHSAVTFTAGSGLSGGGTIAANRTIALSHLGLQALSDPGADTLIGWDDTDGALKWFILGTGLSYSHATHTLSASGGGGGEIGCATKRWTKTIAQKGAFLYMGQSMVISGLQEDDSDADSIFTRVRTNGSSIGNGGGLYISGNYFARSAHNPTFICKFKTHANIDDERFFIGMNASNTDWNADPTNGELIMLRYVSGTANFTYITKDGTTLNSVDSGVTVAASTIYTIKIVVSGDGTSIAFTINGGNLQTLTTNLPTLTQPLGLSMWNVTQAAAYKYVSISHIYCEAD